MTDLHERASNENEYFSQYPIRRIGGGSAWNETCSLLQLSADSYIGIPLQAIITRIRKQKKIWLEKLVLDLTDRSLYHSHVHSRV